MKNLIRNESKNILTKREQEVLKLLAESNTVKEVATILGVSYTTVDAHKTKVMRKIGVNNRVGLVFYAIRKGIIKLI
ncbi:MAG TPA: LuxR C-terminal-related transcriptional regulator [Nitrospiria bacterium]|jgi:DNA-binding CsgD family transcriptional regulator